MLKPPELTRRIDYGHILQAGILFVTVTGGVIGSYVAFQSRLTALHENFAAQQQQIAQFTGQLQKIQDEQKAIIRDNTMSMNKIADQLVDLRVLVAGMKDGRK